MDTWIESAVFYHIYPLGFCGAPPENAGGEPVNRIGRVSEFIPHLKELGVNAVYFGPVNLSHTHGYDTSDYYQIDNRLGDKAAFGRVCDELHKNGIRVVLDGVFNHVGRGFWAFRDVQENKEASPYCGWFSGLHFGAHSPMGDPFTYDTWGGYWELVKLNLKNPDVVSHLLGAVESWINDYQIDGLRLDAADCVDPDFFKALRRFCKEKKSGFWLMGEIIHGDYNRWANPDMLDSVTNYECYKGLYSSHNDKNYFEIAHSLNRQFGSGGIYQNMRTYNFVDNHDVNRLMSTLRDGRYSKNVYTILFTMPGVPSVYYGSEWGIQGAKQNGSDLPLRPAVTIEDAKNGDTELCRHIAKLAALYKAEPALQNGGFETVDIKNEQLVYKRVLNGRKITVALNLADKEAVLEFSAPNGGLCDLLGGIPPVTVQSGRASITLPPFSSAVLAKSGGSASPVSNEPEKRDEPSPAPTVRPGRYRHFKGKEYEVVGVAKHSESLEELVVYRQLYGEGGLWVRPLSMFLEMVQANGKAVPRFEYLGGR